MKYGLIGERLCHSYSCEIHAAVADYTYELTELRREKLDDFFRKREFRGINVTIPYKQAVIPYLDEISEKALRIGAVNTVVNRNGRLHGYNTDYAGMRALAERLHIDARGKKILILGTGGTSKTAAVVAEDLGAPEILKVSRNPDVGRSGASDITDRTGRTEKTDRTVSTDTAVGTDTALRTNMSGRPDGYIKTVSYEEAVNCHRDAAFVFNTTPAGMFPDTEGQAISLENFPNLEAVLDVVYNPLRTNLVLEAQSRGIPAEGGLYMLAAQGAAASGLFQGKEMCPEDTEKAFRAVLDQKRNIVLTGMPSSGKTCVGKLLAEKTGLVFRDTDEIITEKIGMPIADYFKKNGEPAFRALESGVIKDLSRTGGQIIATGGGAVLDERNVRALKRSGVLVFLDRSLEKLIATADRPLSSDREALMRRYLERYEIYKSAADVHIPGDGSLEETAALVYGNIQNYGITDKRNYTGR